MPPAPMSPAPRVHRSPSQPPAPAPMHKHKVAGAGRGGGRLWAGPLPQQPHPRCGPQVGGGVPLLLCRDDLHGLVQAGLQAGSSPSGVVCVAGDAGSCKRAAGMERAQCQLRGTGQRGTRPPQRAPGVFLHTQTSPGLAEGAPGRAALRACVPGDCPHATAMAH